MRFLNPSGAWALLALLPVVALYLLKRRATPTRVPSLLLWRLSEARSEASRPFEKLKSQLLFWLRLLLAALMAFALMRPATLGVAGGEKAFVFDLSASMQATVNGQSRLALAKERALQMLDAMPDDRAVTVLGAGATVVQAAVRSTDRAAARAAIEGLRAQNGGAALEGALSLALAMRRDLPALEVVVFSDDYRPSGGGATVVNVGEGADNRAITSLRVSEADGAAYAYARVRNYGAEAALTLECYSGGALCDVREITVEADGAQSARFTLPAGASAVMARIVQKDALAADDARYAAVRAQTEETALLVTDGNVFLRNALSLREGLKLYATDDTALSAAPYDLYVYDGKLPEELPTTGAILAVNPGREVAGVVPQPKRQAAGALRLASGEIARQIGQNLLLSGVAFRAVTPLAGGEAALSLGDGAVLSVTERDGRRVAVLGFDLHDSNLPVKADFPVLMQNLLAYLLPDAQTAVGDAVCGEPVRLTLSGRAASAWVETPGGGRAALSGDALTDTGEIGLYTLVQRMDDGTERRSLFAAHMPEAEADTRLVAGSVAADGGADAAAEGGREWTGWLLLVWLFMLLLEWEVSRRGVSR